MRTQFCGEVTEKLEGQTVTVCGWAHRRRDHGGVIFVDLRDRKGLVQIVFNPDSAEMFKQAERIRNEFVLQVTGVVSPRPEGTVNPNMTTGQIEIVADALNVLNTSDPIPFSLDDHQNVSEEVRLKYRYMDLRRPDMYQKIAFRSKVTSFIRRFLDNHDFLEIETPILMKATPEGARDYLVPSRTHPGSISLRLPQSPQLFKQMLMMAGMERYYQIARCFRDEDLRADRQPEFTQLGYGNVVCINEEDSSGSLIVEIMMRDMFKSLLDVELPAEFPHV